MNPGLRGAFAEELSLITCEKDGFRGSHPVAVQSRKPARKPTPCASPVAMTMTPVTVAMAPMTVAIAWPDVEAEARAIVATIVAAVPVAAMPPAASRRLLDQCGIGRLHPAVDRTDSRGRGCGRRQHAKCKRHDRERETWSIHAVCSFPMVARRKPVLAETTWRRRHRSLRGREGALTKGRQLSNLRRGTSAQRLLRRGSTAAAHEQQRNEQRRHEDRQTQRDNLQLGQRYDPAAGRRQDEAADNEKYAQRPF